MSSICEAIETTAVRLALATLLCAACADAPLSQADGGNPSGNPSGDGGGALDGPTPDAVTGPAAFDRVHANVLSYYTLADADRAHPRVAPRIEHLQQAARDALATLDPVGKWNDIDYAALPACWW